MSEEDYYQEYWESQKSEKADRLSADKLGLQKLKQAAITRHPESVAAKIFREQMY